MKTLRLPHLRRGTASHRLAPVLLSLALASLAAADLPRSTPEAQGVSAAGLLEFIDVADREIDSLHSLMLVRHGHVVAEGWWAPYDAATPHRLYSLSKSFTSTAVGMAIAEGRFSLDDPVLKFFPDDAPADPSANLRAMRVRDLLTMSAGHADETSSAADAICAKTFLAHPVPHAPGTHFRYNTPATFMLSAIVQQRTGQTVCDYLGPRLFAPLGIEPASWATNWQGISLGGYGLRVRTEDIARFGQLYLQEGSWEGRQLLPAWWIGMATSRQVANGDNPDSDWNQGYGFQFWRCRHGTYRGDGAFGQYCIVMPEQDAVVAITSGVRDMQAVLNLIWDRLLPAFQAAARPEESGARERLQARLQRLSLPFPKGPEDSPGAAAVLGRTYELAENEQKLESLRLEAADDGGGWVLVTRSAKGESRIPCGFRAWKRSPARAGGVIPDEPLAAAGAWVGSDTFEATLCARETPHLLTVRLRFAGDEVFVDAAFNVAFGPARWPQLKGKAEG